MTEREIFQAAIDIPEMNDRQSYLDSACGTNVALREQVEQLLRAHENASRFLETPAAEQLTPGTVDETEETTMLPKSSAAPRSESVEDGVSLEFLVPSTKPGALGRLAHYEVLELLGRGAFGIVLKAFDEKLHRMVAIKVMNPELAATSPPRKRFLREAQSSAKVRHENIVAIHAVEEQPFPYLVMEYIPGGTLQQRLDQKGPLETEDILRIGQQIALGLAAAHAQGLIHRDIKPANILIESGVEERVKITDFGLARATDDASLTQSGLIAGTPMYMAPEQAKGQPLDHRTDLFSLGSVLYTMASGRPPFRAANTIAVLKRVCEDIPRPITEIIPETPSWLGDIISKLHAKEPDDRFQTAKEVADVLGQHLAFLREPMKAARPAPIDLPVELATVETPKVRRPAKPSGWTPTAVALSIIAGVLLIPVVGLLLVVFAIAIPAYQASQSLATQGTLVIETDDLSVSIGLDDRQLWGPGEFPAELRLNPGAHIVQFFRDGKPVGRERIQITTGQNVVVHWPDQPGAEQADIAFTPEWTPLFNGNDFTGWQKNDQWTIENGILVSRVPVNAPRPPAMLVTERNDFRNFHARIEAKINNGGDSGFFFRFGEPGEHALQVQIAAAPTGMGSVLRETTTLSKSRRTIPPDTWTTMEVLAQGPQISVFVDGSQVVRWTESPGNIPAGPLAFAAGPAGTVIAIRKVEVKRLPPFTAPSRAVTPPTAIAPFDTAAAKAHQEAWAKHLGTDVETINSVGAKMILIPPGEFLMGAPDTDADAAPQEKPQHRVHLTKPFAISATEITHRQFRLFVEATKYVTQAESDGQGAFEVNPHVRKPVYTWNSTELKPQSRDEFPVRCVSWEDARRFCEWLTQTEGRVYRLPTEAEWEFACRAGTATRYSFGKDFSDTPSPPGTSGAPLWPVAQLPANPFGLFDMHGSVNEICWDSGRTFTTEPVTDPLGSLERNVPAVVRGGAVSSNPARLRSSNRYLTDARQFPESNFATLMKGFRIVAEFGPSSQAKVPMGTAIAPFDAAAAKAHQEAWAKHLGVPVEYTNSLGMKFRLIPPGEFTMGSTAEEIAAALKDVGGDKYLQKCIQSEAPQHKVILTQPIYLGVNEVTQAEYEEVMGVNPSHFAPMGMGKEAVAGLETTEHPVEMVSWNDAAEFCAKLSKQEKFKPFYFRAGETITPLDGTGYRLPSEAEWEFACRAGTATKYWIGDKDEDLVRAGWFGGNSGGRTHAAGELKANPFGLSDIHGNVWEWVQDGWDASYYGQFHDKPAINPNSPFSTGSQRVIRGGHWNSSASLCRSSNRHAINPSTRFNHVGFRVSLVVEAVKAALSQSTTTLATTARRRFASDEWIDVLPLIDPALDKWDVPNQTGKNAWRMDNGELVVGRDPLGSKLLLPLDSEWQGYECELEFTRRIGSSGFNMNLPTKPGECPLFFDPPGREGVYLGMKTKGVAMVREAQIVTGQRVTTRVEVRRQESADHITVAVNGVTVGEWTGDRNAIAFNYYEGFPNDRRVSLWIHPGNEFVFHRIRVKILDDGTAETLRAVPIAAVQAARENVAEKELFRDQMQASHKAGQATALQLIYTEIDLSEARAHLHSLEGQPVEVLAAYTQLVSLREREHQQIAEEVKAGRLTVDDLSRADASLRDAEGRREQAKAAMPATLLPWQPLFNGKDLTGWKPHPDEPGNWHVENGVLVGSEKPAYLFSERTDFTDFHLRAELQINEGGDGGIMVRSPFLKPGSLGLPGYEAQIQAGKPLVEGWTTGAIGGSFPQTGWRLLVPAAVRPKADDRFVLEIIAKGNEVETRINGEKVAWYIDPDRAFTRGHIALQQSGPTTTVQFYKIEVLPLTP